MKSGFSSKNVSLFIPKVNIPNYNFYLKFLNILKLKKKILNVKENMSDVEIAGVKFNIVGLLGEGSYGKVYALKVIENKINVGKDKEGIKSLRELDIISRIKHPNLMGAELVITDYNINTDTSRVGIMMEKADRDLYVAMFDGKLNMVSRYDILHQICFGLKALHESGYLHLDLKPLNILLLNSNKDAKNRSGNQSTQVKITDFGLSILTETINKTREKHMPIKLQTIDHRSINVINGERNYKASDDIWSLGIIFLSVLSYGKSLFKGILSKDFSDNVVRKVYEEKLSNGNIDETLKVMLTDPAAKKAINIIKRMLDFDAGKRATLYEVLEFFKFNKKEYVSPKYENPIVKNGGCDEIIYEGFYHLFKLGTSLQIRLESFYLAADIFQRSLTYKNISTTKEGNRRNIIYQATLSFYMAIKMVESYFADIEVLTKLSGNLFSPDALLLGECALVNNFKGILYPMNLFRASTTERRLLEGFELLRNCFLYPEIDMKMWLKFSLQEQPKEGKFNKYILFYTFIPYTRYYRYFLKDDTSSLYLSDRKN
jgi:serine/threonine protein kinase